jgi:hypothetical protein
LTGAKQEKVIEETVEFDGAVSDGASITSNRKVNTALIEL